MKNSIFILLFITFFSPLTGAQSEAGDSFPRRISYKNIASPLGQLTYGIDYPRNYDKTKKYPVLLCLSGGGFEQDLAAYFNFVYTPRKTFREFIKVYPITNNETSILRFSIDDWKQYVDTLKVTENLKDTGWVISGASNGGVATYNVVSARPKTFDGFITIPGSHAGQPLLEEWKRYNVLIVYMEKDTPWIQGSKNAYKKLKGHVNAIEILEIPNEGHVLPVGFDIEPIYQQYLDLSKN